MYVYALTGYLDYETEAHFKSLWRNLSEDNIMQAFKYCKNKISKIYCKLNEVALIEIELNEEEIAIGSEVVF